MKWKDKIDLAAMKKQLGVKTVEECVSDFCPSEVLGIDMNKGPCCHGLTAVMGETGIVGCRGMSCEKCWDQEVPDET